MPGRGHETSYYELLEVNANASFEEIEQSYQRMVAYTSPESLAVYSMLDEEELQRMRSQLEEAYRTLSDPDRRAAYDKARHGMSNAYPSVMVPEQAGGASLSVGMMHRRDEPSPDMMDVDAIFRSGGVVPDEMAQARSEPIVERELTSRERQKGGSEPSRPTELPRSESVYGESRSEPSRAEAPPVEARPEPSRFDIPRQDNPAVARAPETTVSEAASVEPSRSSDAHRPEPTRAEAPRVEPAPIASPSKVEPQRDEPSAEVAVVKRRPPVAPASSPGKRRRLVFDAGIEITAETEFSGALLRRLRESVPADLDEVADITKVSKRYLVAVEENDFEALPAPVYVRGFVVEYARVLGLDHQRVAQSYMSLYKRYRGEGS